MLVDWHETADCLQALFRGEDSDDAHMGGVFLARAISLAFPWRT